jgi:hypothetical protein
MRVKTQQIVWHEGKPVLSLDFHPSGLLATGGADRDIKARRGAQAQLAADARSSALRACAGPAPRRRRAAARCKALPPP